MISESKIKQNREQIIRGLLVSGRKGMDHLINSLDSTGFFESPASSKYHGCYKGGLAQHSINVYDEFCSLTEKTFCFVNKETAAIACYLHDVCKIGAYVGDPGSYSLSKDHPGGHAVLSVKRIKEFIQLTELEEKMILYHMGVYGLNEFDDRRGEYPLRGGGMANAWHHFSAVKLLYFADEIASLKEKKQEELVKKKKATSGALTIEIKGA